MSGGDRIQALAKELNFVVQTDNGCRRFGPSRHMRGCSPGKGCEVFAARLPYDAFEDEIYPFFKQAGNIFKIKLFLNLDSTTRGYCFVEYTNQSDANRAVQQLNGTYMRGNQVVVDHSTDHRVLRLKDAEVPLELVKEQVEARAKGLKKATLIAADTPPAILLEFSEHRLAYLAMHALVPVASDLWGHCATLDWAPNVDVQFRKEFKRLKNLRLGSTLLPPLHVDVTNPNGKGHRISPDSGLGSWPCNVSITSSTPSPPRDDDQTTCGATLAVGGQLSLQHTSSGTQPAIPSNEFNQYVNRQLIEDVVRQVISEPTFLTALKSPDCASPAATNNYDVVKQVINDPAFLASLRAAECPPQLASAAVNNVPGERRRWSSEASLDGPLVYSAPVYNLVLASPGPQPLYQSPSLILNTAAPQAYLPAQPNVPTSFVQPPMWCADTFTGIPSAQDDSGKAAHEMYKNGVTGPKAETNYSNNLLLPQESFKENLSCETGKYDMWGTNMNQMFQGVSALNLKDRQVPAPQGGMIQSPVFKETPVTKKVLTEVKTDNNYLVGAVGGPVKTPRKVNNDLYFDVPPGFEDVVLAGIIRASDYYTQAPGHEDSCRATGVSWAYDWYMKGQAARSEKRLYNRKE